MYIYKVKLSLCPYTWQTVDGSSIIQGNHGWIMENHHSKFKLNDNFHEYLSVIFVILNSETVKKNMSRKLVKKYMKFLICWFFWGRSNRGSCQHQNEHMHCDVDCSSVEVNIVELCHKDAKFCAIKGRNMGRLGLKCSDPGLPSSFWTICGN